MANLSKSELNAIHAERTKFFTPQWFGDLFSGRLSPGDTFWIGNYGPALIVVPLLVIVALFTAMAMPGHLEPLFGSVALAVGLYRLVVLSGLVRSVLRTPGPKVWRWIGVFWTLYEAALLIWLGSRLFGG
ncbi:hypothetical protein [Thioclava sp.]|uniref:hypothetical protein n=1 Tax=Thioclava sp. TaxID=1933450 RepID=UPI003AA91869